MMVKTRFRTAKEKVMDPAESDIKVVGPADTDPVEIVGKVVDSAESDRKGIDPEANRVFVG